MGGLADELKRREGDEQNADAPETFVLIHDMQNYKKLRQEDDYSFSTADAGAAPNPAAVLLNLISEGPSRGFHVIATFDTYNNASRFPGRKTLSEFELRVLFQMRACVKTIFTYAATHRVALRFAIPTPGFFVVEPFD